jgi:hypothetical protein
MSDIEKQVGNDDQPNPPQPRRKRSKSPRTVYNLLPEYPSGPDWVTSAQLCYCIGIHDATMRRWVSNGLLPKPYAVCRGSQPNHTAGSFFYLPEVIDCLQKIDPLMRIKRLHAIRIKKLADIDVAQNIEERLGWREPFTNTSGSSAPVTSSA